MNDRFCLDFGSWSRGLDCLLSGRLRLNIEQIGFGLISSLVHWPNKKFRNDANYADLNLALGTINGDRTWK